MAICKPAMKAHADGFITLLGRKADFFKISTGRRISPLGIEKALHKCRYLEQVIVIGEGRKVPIACATIDQAKHAPDNLAFVEALRSEIKAIITKELLDYQKPAAILLLSTEFAVDLKK